MMRPRWLSVLLKMPGWCSQSVSGSPPACGTEAESAEKPATPAFLRHLALAMVVLVIAGGATLRLYATFANPAFDYQQPEGLLMSDPALLFYITHRIVENNGLPPADFRTDLRVEYPQPSDLPAMFTVGQEFYLAWGYLLFGGDLPLHVYIVIAMGLFAALSAVGVYGLTRELTRSYGWAAFACLVYGVTLANYRTLGFILIREDFSLPFFSAHLWLIVRAVRVRTPGAFAWAALPLLAAVATWHAMTFIVALETAVVFAWYLRTGKNLMSERGAWVMPMILAVGALSVPVLLAKWFVLSLPMQLLAVLMLMAFLEKRKAMKPALRVGLALSAWLVLLVLCFPAARDYSHVFEMVWSKLVHLAVLPDDPNVLSFGTRLLWQGPFASASPGYMAGHLGITGLLMSLALIGTGYNWLHGRGDDKVQVILAFGALSVFFTFFVKRLLVLTGLIAPVATVFIFLRFRRRWSRTTACALTLAIQVAIMAVMLPVITRTSWYLPEHGRNLREFIFWARTHLEDGGAMASDYVNASAILAHTRHPVVLEPKYETRSSRDRIEQFLTTFYYESAEKLHALLQQWGCRYFLVDVYTMSALRYQAGYPVWQKPVVGIAAEAFLSPWKDRYRTIPGFRLIYVNRENPTTWRLYRLE